MTRTASQYSLAWREYRRLSRRYWIVLLVSPVAILALFALLNLLARLAFGERCHDWACNDVPLALSGLAWGAAVVRANYLQMRWRCPRCGEPFFRARHMGAVSLNAFAPHCRHCGLAKWAVEDNAPAA